MAGRRGTPQMSEMARSDTSSGGTAARGVGSFGDRVRPRSGPDVWWFPARRRSRLLSVMPAAMSRLACFLWTAWRVTPSASATCGQLQPDRMACSTAASSI
ncbi:hypothetical protein FHR32_000659 [Streptosporangium album]|uniref:Uncharacterized protein n=1 Tax=Streptosporangium album TaxID=47479 RepID=A0A7W7RQK5_9ACTN|nr:hypothetical protein [Streptosporangium album]